MFVAPHAQRSEYSGRLYHYILLEELLESSVANHKIIETQKEVALEPLRKAARYTYLQRCEFAGIPKFLNPEERSELYKLGHEIAEELLVNPRTPVCSIATDLILKYLKNHALQVYDWPEPRFPK